MYKDYELVAFQIKYQLELLQLDAWLEIGQRALLRQWT